MERFVLCVVMIAGMFSGHLFYTLGKENPNETEHVIKMLGAENTEETNSFDFVVTFTGDCLLASPKNKTTEGSFNDYAQREEPTYFLEKVAPIFEKDDYTIVNLENVLSDNKLSEVKKNHSPAYWYYSKTSNTEILTSSSVEAVSLANNHSGDYGEKGMTDTIEAVKNAELLYGTNDETIYLEKNGYKIAVICHGLWNGGQAEEIIERIKEEEEKTDFQIVYYHGGTERIHEPEQWKINASRRLVDYGADLVIGNHPHVLQPMETYNGVDIVYSMGNFCFGDGKRPENRSVIFQLKLNISNDGTLNNKSSELIPCYVYTGDFNNYQPTPIEDEEDKQAVLDFMYGEAELPYKQ